MSSSPPSPSGSYAAAPSIASASPSSGGISARLTNTISSYLFESAISIQSSPARLPTQKRKTPLSLPQTTANFRQFVQKSGGLFYFQDAVEATLLWDDWSWTLMWMGIWAVIAIYPYLLLAAPSFVLCIILVKTHQARFPLSNLPGPSRGVTTNADKSMNTTTPQAEAGLGRTPADALRHSVQHPSSIGEGAVRPPLVPNPPAEGSIRYLENLRDIQNMMKMVPDGYDAIVPIVPYLNWSSYNRSLLVLQLSILTTVVMFFIGPLLPLRLILLVGGEAMFIATHPWVHPIVEAIGKMRGPASKGAPASDRQLRSVMRKRGREAGHRLRTWLELDRLDDTAWEKGWRDVEMFQNERFDGPGLVSSSASKRAGWSAANLQVGERRPWTKGSDGWSAASTLEGTGYELDLRQVASSLEQGWEWVEGDDWRIDWAGDWSAVGVDDEGYVYTDGDWQRPAPYPYGHPEQPQYPVLPPEAAAGTEEGRSKRETDGRSLPAAALSSNVNAQTRRRRWLRRAVRV